MDGVRLIAETNQEYERLYAHFGSLIEQRTSDVDIEPLRLTTDAFMIARQFAALVLKSNQLPIPTSSPGVASTCFR